MPDAGTYTLRGENRNGSDKVRKHHQQITNILIIFLTIGMKVDLDLVVLETGHDAECELLKSGNLECRCSQSFRWIFTVVNFAALDWKWQSCVQDIGTISGNADRRRLWRRIFRQRNLRSSRLRWKDFISSLISLLNYLMHSYLTIQCKWRRSSKLSLCIVNVSGRVSVHNFVEEARNFVKIYSVSTVCNIKFYLNCQTNMRPSFKCSL